MASFSQTAQVPPLAGALPGPSAAQKPDYVIGPADVLDIRVRNDASFDVKVLVRPDGKITFLYLPDIDAAGLSTMKLAERISENLSKYYETGPPKVTVFLTETKSKWVYIEGRGIAKSGPFSLTGPLNVMQLITMAGGLTEYAKGKEIKIFREEHGVTKTIAFNYETFQNASNTKQNIELNPGDIVNVP